MENMMFDEIPKGVKLSTGRWVHVYRNNGDGYRVHDAVDETEVGRILVDDQEHWIYDGHVLSVAEQEEIVESLKNPQPVTNVIDWTAILGKNGHL
jgi:hypothetical protein